MDTVVLNRGRGTIELVKSEDLIAVRPTSQAGLKEALSSVPTGITYTNVGTNLAGFEIVRLDGSKQEMENCLAAIRQHYSVDAGSHVYHTPNDVAPIIPTGKITLRFNSDSTQEQRQRVLDEYKLEIVDIVLKEGTGGASTETVTVRTTSESPNPLKVAEDLQNKDGIVTLAEPDLAIRGQLFSFEIPTDTFLREQWHLKNDGVQFGSGLGLKVGADARVVAAWQRLGSLGSPSCTVAIIDDGFDLSHPDLSGGSKVVAPWDFMTNTNDPSPKRFNPDSRFGDYHGTACAGVAVGNVNGGGIIGAAPSCRFMPVRWHSSISDDTIKQQFDYVARQGAWVVSCSWGVSADVYYPSTVMDEAIADCARKGRNGLGCVVVFAAGNANHDINDPDGGTVDGFALHPDVIAVAACNSRDEKSNYSNFGREISVCAPSSGAGGRGILTSDVRGTFQYQGTTFEAGYEAGDYTKTFGGTSSSTPLVAGICALILSANPSLTAKQVKEILERTARPIGDQSSYQNGHSVFHGYGCVDADAAVQLALAGIATLNLSGRFLNVYSLPKDNKQETSGDTLYGSEFWGIQRHELIAGTAAKLLTEYASAKIQQILAPLGHADLSSIAGWADQIKGRSANDTQDPDTQQFLRDFPNDASRDWHYVNLPLGIESYAQAQQLGFTRSDDVVQMINQMVRVLQGNSTIMSELNALRWLVHLVGDVHQPIHIGCGFIDTNGASPQLVHDPYQIIEKGLEHDRGGNNIVLPLGGNVSLHSYWDSRLSGTINVNVDSHSDTTTEDEFESNAEVKQEFINKLLTILDDNNIRSFSRFASVDGVPPDHWAEQWATDSLLEARKAYESIQINEKNGGKYIVSWEGKSAYDLRCKPIVSRQLTLAAKNLAKLLNVIFADSASFASMLHSDVSEKESIIYLTKVAIIEVAGLQGNPDQLKDKDTFTEMDFTDPMYNQLAGRLTDIVQEYNEEENVSRMEVEESENVGNCVEMVLEKAAVS